MEDDFKKLFDSSDLRRFSDILTKEEMELCESLDSAHKLSSEIIKYFCEKPLHLLEKIPECLRAAENYLLAGMLEDAHRRQAGGREQKLKTPAEVQERDDEAKLAFVRPSRGVQEATGPTANFSLPSCQRDLTQGNFRINSVQYL